MIWQAKTFWSKTISWTLKQDFVRVHCCFSSGFYCYFVLLPSETFWSQLPQISTDVWKMWTRKRTERHGKFLCFSQCFLSSGVSWNAPEFQHCVGCGEGELQENFEKDALFYVGTQKLQKIINTALLSQLLLSRIVSFCRS